MTKEKDYLGPIEKMFKHPKRLEELWIGPQMENGVLRCYPDQDQVERTISQFILDKYLIKTIKELDLICFYENGVFIPDRRDIRINEILYSIAENTSIVRASRKKGEYLEPFQMSIPKKNLIKDMIKSKTYISLEEFDKNENRINVLNGHLILQKENDIYRWDFIEHFTAEESPYLSLIQLPIIYDPHAENLGIDDMISKIVGFDEVPFIYEIYAYLIMPTLKFGKAFMFYGPPGTGKTSLLNLIYLFIPRELISEIELQSLSKRFQMSNLCGKMVNVFDDLADKKLSLIHVFKKIITNKYLSGEAKHLQGNITWINRCKLIFSANRTPDVPNTVGNDFWKRWGLVSCYEIFKELGIEKKGLRDKKWPEKEKSGLFNQILKAWIRLEERGGFPPEWDDSERVKKLWNLEKNPAAMFVEKCCELSPEATVEYEDFYKELNKFRQLKNGKNISKTLMTQSLKKLNIKKTSVNKEANPKSCGYNFQGICFSKKLKDKREKEKKKQEDLERKKAKTTGILKHIHITEDRRSTRGDLANYLDHSNFKYEDHAKILSFFDELQIFMEEVKYKAFKYEELIQILQKKDIIPRELLEPVLKYFLEPGIMIITGGKWKFTEKWRGGDKNE